MIKLCECGCGLPAPIASKTDNKHGYKKGKPRRFIVGHHMKIYGAPMYKGGRIIRVDGRPMLWMPGHHRSDKRGYVLEYIITAETALGTPLPAKAVVHHHGDGLVVCQDNAYHMLLHQRLRAYNVCGHHDWRKCVHCKEYDSPEKLTICGNTIYHKKCESLAKRNKRKEEA